MNMKNGLLLSLWAVAGNAVATITLHNAALLEAIKHDEALSKGDVVIKIQPAAGPVAPTMATGYQGIQNLVERITPHILTQEYLKKALTLADQCKDNATQALATINHQTSTAANNEKESAKVAFEAMSKKLGQTVADFSTTIVLQKFEQSMQEKLMQRQKTNPSLTLDQLYREALSDIATTTNPSHGELIDLIKKIHRLVAAVTEDEAVIEQTKKLEQLGVETKTTQQALTIALANRIQMLRVQEGLTIG